MVFIFGIFQKKIYQPETNKRQKRLSENMVENIIIALVFLAALFYVGKGAFNSFFAKNDKGCAKGCASCPTDFLAEIEKNLPQNK
jgi:hypothetical protein